MGDREDLTKLKADVERDQPDVAGQLNSIAERLGNGTVWFGPQADAFSGDLGDEKDALVNRSGDLPGDVQDKLATTPEDPTEEGG